jgi:hypothetical protein
VVAAAIPLDCRRFLLYSIGLAGVSPDAGEFNAVPE